MLLRAGPLLGHSLESQNLGCWRCELLPQQTANLDDVERCRDASGAILRGHYAPALLGRLLIAGACASDNRTAPHCGDGSATQTQTTPGVSMLEQVISTGLSFVPSGEPTFLSMECSRREGGAAHHKWLSPEVQGRARFSSSFVFAAGEEDAADLPYERLYRLCSARRLSSGVGTRIAC